MPRRPEFTERYVDALQALAVATGRTARVTNANGQYALRVDFEFGRYLTATNTDAVTGLADADAAEPGQVRVFDPIADDGSPHLVADQSATWLIDAYDAAVVDLLPPAEVRGEF